MVGIRASNKKGCYLFQVFVCLWVMEPQDVSRQMALYYVIGIVVAAVIFRIIRGWRKGRKEDRSPPPL